MMQVYAVLIVMVVLLAVVFVGYYVFRLLEARQALSGSSARRRSRRAGVAGGPLGRTPHDPPVSGRRDGGPAEGLGVREVGAVRTHGRGSGLRQISDEPVFLRKSKAGEVTVQIDSKPATPLKYVLDTRVRAVLDRVVRQADADYGGRWAVLAEEDSQGRLKLTRLG